MPREYNCAAADCFTAPRSPRRYRFAHQRRLDRYSDPRGTMPLHRETHGRGACYVEGCCCCDLCRKAGTARRTVEADRVREREHRRHPEMRRYRARTRYDG